MKTCSEYSIILSKDLYIAKEQFKLVKEALKLTVGILSNYSIKADNYDKIKVIIENEVFCFPQASYPDYSYYEDLNLGNLCDKEKIRDALFNHHYIHMPAV